MTGGLTVVGLRMSCVFSWNASHSAGCRCRHQLQTSSWCCSKLVRQVLKPGRRCAAVGATEKRATGSWHGCRSSGGQNFAPCHTPNAYHVPHADCAGGAGGGAWHNWGEAQNMLMLNAVCDLYRIQLNAGGEEAASAAGPYKMQRLSTIAAGLATLHL